MINDLKKKLSLNPALLKSIAIYNWFYFYGFFKIQYFKQVFWRNILEKNGNFVFGKEWI